jgi:methylphosphotriester-DNA--protein-cysteine methyltransferase
MSELARRVWSAPSSAGVRAMLRALCELALRVTLADDNPRGESSLTELASCLLLASPLLDRRALAADLGISEGFLSRSFSRELGVSFVEHRARARLGHFLALVEAGNPTLLDAALAAGFGSYSQFHRVFTRVSGMRPRDYVAGGRHQLQLFVVSELDRPETGPLRRLPDRQRHRPPLDDQTRN